MFFIKLSEYNVAFHAESRRPLHIAISDDEMHVTNYSSKNNYKENLVVAEKLILDNLEEIQTVSQLNVQNYKGGRQKLITIKYKENMYQIIGNTNNERSRNLYNKLKDVLVNLN